MNDVIIMLVAFTLCMMFGYLMGKVSGYREAMKHIPSIVCKAYEEYEEEKQKK